MTLGKFYEHCTVSLVSYTISRVFLLELILYILKTKIDVWDVL